MSIKDRFVQIRDLLRQSPNARSLHDALLLNQLQLENVADIKALTEQPGWKIIEEYLRNQIRQCSDKCLQLAADPKKNEHELTANYAISFVCKTILKMVIGTMALEADLVNDFNELEQRQSAAVGS